MHPCDCLAKLLLPQSQGQASANLDQLSHPALLCAGFSAGPDLGVSHPGQSWDPDARMPSPLHAGAAHLTVCHSPTCTLPHHLGINSNSLHWNAGLSSGDPNLTFRPHLLQPPPRPNSTPTTGPAFSSLPAPACFVFCFQRRCPPGWPGKLLHIPQNPSQMSPRLCGSL